MSLDMVMLMSGFIGGLIFGLSINRKKIKRYEKRICDI